LQREIKWVDYTFREYEHARERKILELKYPGKNDYVDGINNYITFFFNKKEYKFRIKFSTKIQLQKANDFFALYD